MLGINDALKTVKSTQKTVNEEICDKLLGDCQKCPFGLEKCVASSLVNIEYGLENLKGKLKEIINE